MISERMSRNLERGRAMAALFTVHDRLDPRFGAENVYDFSIGNPNVPAPATVKETIIRETEAHSELELHSYTKPEGYPFVRKAIAEHDREKFDIDLTERNIFMTAGASTALNAVFLTLLDIGDEVIVPAPYFSEYAVYVSNAGGELVEVPACPDTFELDVREIEKAITRKTKAVLINTPNNPTGVIYSEKNLRDLADMLYKKSMDLDIDIALISDEPYRELAYDGNIVPCISKFYDNTIVVYSFSKSLSLPGERIGYLTLSDSMTQFKEIREGLQTAIRSTIVNAPALMQRVAAACLDDECDVAYYDRNGKELYEGLTKIGYECVKPQGSFYLWMKTPAGIDDEEFAAKAEDYRIALVPGSAFAGPGYVRISYCVAHEMIEKAMPYFRALYEDVTK